MAQVLVVDDNPALRLVARAMLEAAGHGVAEAGSGAEALDALCGRRADVVLCDLSLPGMDGLQTIRELRALQPGLKVVAMSGVGPPGAGVDLLGQAWHGSGPPGVRQRNSPVARPRDAPAGRFAEGAGGTPYRRPGSSLAPARRRVNEKAPAATVEKRPGPGAGLHAKRVKVLGGLLRQALP